jgi:hypothetical protein
MTRVRKVVGLGCIILVLVSICTRFQLYVHRVCRGEAGGAGSWPPALCNLVLNVSRKGVLNE